MTSPAVSRLLISHITLRGPELRQLYELLAEQPGLTYDDLLGALTPLAAGGEGLELEEAPLREALNFLLVAGLVRQQGASRRRASFFPTPQLAGAGFHLLVLHHTQTHQDERQRALALVHRELVAADTLAVTPQLLREQMERGPYGGLFAWTGEKITLWGHLAAYLGLVWRLDREGTILVAPQLELVSSALAWAAGRLGSTALGPLLRETDRCLFACYTARGRVHQGVAQSLLALERRGGVELAHHADAAQSVLLRGRRVSEARLRPAAAGGPPSREVPR